MYAASSRAPYYSIRYVDQAPYFWLWTHAPCSWKENVELRFTTVPFRSLQPAGCRLDPAITAAHLARLRRGRAVAPLVVCAGDFGGWYIHDGNHRYQAMRRFFAEDENAWVRVAVAVPNAGFRFVHHWFGPYGTYRLQPMAPLLSSRTPAPFHGRIMVLVAHQDDETACAGLLQRLTGPIIVYATNGAPADEFFWRRYASRARYASVRRREAEAALAGVRMASLEFLDDHAPTGIKFYDQQLYRALPQAFDAISNLVRRYRPDAVLVPAYEGGHPDHDTCSFLGALLRLRFHLPVWEMPLYHRSETGLLVCQQFRAANGTERALMLTRQEQRTRDSMIACYASQPDVADFVSARVELFRPQAEYDFSRPPHLGALNYQVWQWPISPKEVCRAFEHCARARETTHTVRSAPLPAGEPAPTTAVALEA